jgi:hypothetical protein
MVGWVFIWFLGVRSGTAEGGTRSNGVGSGLAFGTSADQGAHGFSPSFVRQAVTSFSLPFNLPFSGGSELAAYGGELNVGERGME